MATLTRTISDPSCHSNYRVTRSSIKPDKINYFGGVPASTSVNRLRRIGSFRAPDIDGETRRIIRESVKIWVARHRSAEEHDARKPSLEHPTFDISRFGRETGSEMDGGFNRGDCCVRTALAYLTFGQDCSPTRCPTTRDNSGRSDKSQDRFYFTQLARDNRRYE